MDLSLMTMSRHVDPEFFTQQLVVNPYATLASITSGCILVGLQEFQSFILDGILKIHIAGVVSNKHVTVSSVRDQSRFPEIVTDREADYTTTKLDVKNFDNVKLVQNAGKGKKGGKKGRKKKSNEGNQNAENERATQRRKEEEERLQRWNEDWDRKLKAQEALDEIPCCSAQGLFLKPRTQSNIWIKVTQEKTTQDVQMAFMHVPVPRPKAPPLPKLVKVEPVEVPPPPQKKKKKGKGKKK